MCGNGFLTIYRKEQVPFKFENKKNICCSRLKEDLTIDTNFDPCRISLNCTFKIKKVAYSYPWGALGK
jgi:hypothetical protein